MHLNVQYVGGDTIHVTNTGKTNVDWIKTNSLTDENDRTIPRTDLEEEESLTIHVTVPENADSVKLTLARADHRFVEFRVKPTLRDGP